MQIPRNTLIRATKKQLTAVGITRECNPGWLKAAVIRDFSKEEIEAFELAGCRSKTTASSRKFFSPPDESEFEWSLTVRGPHGHRFVIECHSEHALFRELAASYPDNLKYFRS